MQEEKQFDVRYMRISLASNYGSIDYFNCIMSGENPEKVQEKFLEKHENVDKIIHIKEINLT